MSGNHDIQNGNLDDIEKVSAELVQAIHSSKRGYSGLSFLFCRLFTKTYLQVKEMCKRILLLYSINLNSLHFLFFSICSHRCLNLSLLDKNSLQNYYYNVVLFLPNVCVCQCLCWTKAGKPSYGDDTLSGPESIRLSSSGCALRRLRFQWWNH